MDAVLDRFSAPTREWFDGAFPAPTAAQLGAWDSIASGSHTLVVAPTGSGKTLSAFLWALDRLATAVEAGASDEKRAAERRTTEQRTTKVLYISPLKALGVDVERNLRAPLVGITQTAKRLGFEPPEIRVGVRSGDTPTGERRKMIKTPPDILITTPESLFLMLTSSARETLTGVETVIVDEVHAVAGTKRGAHLALSLERLDMLRDKPVQRIGLSATVRPHEEVGRFLAGSAPIRIVAPPAAKTFDLTVRVPVEDMTELGIAEPDPESLSPTPQAGSIWPHVEEQIVDLILDHRSSIVFANSRRLAEKLTARLNEIYAERLGGAVEKQGRPPAQLGAPTEVNYGADPLLARAHHGSVSKDQRAIIEDDLKSGRLRCVVATSSLELGIDMGAVDLVVQVEAPPSVASGLQRVGRAGHQVGEISRGVLFPKHRTDLIHCAVTVERMTNGKIEALEIPANPLDILAQQTVAATALEPLDVEQWYDVVRRSGSFATLPRSAYESTLDLLAGRYPSDEFAELRPRLVWDRDGGTLTGRPGSQRLAVTSGGAIPDRGLFAVYMVGERQSRVGELDEEMVYESRVGDVFALGATSWRIEEITYDRVLVSPAYGLPGRLPFWHGDGLGRPAELGEALGGFLRELSSSTPDEVAARLVAAGLDTNATTNLAALIEDQQQATGRVPTDRTLVVERFRDELGDWRLVLHSPYGLRVHAPWALAIGARLRERFGVDAAPTASDDGIIVRLPDTDDTPPGAELFAFERDEIEDIVTDEVGGSALFASRFRECAARALLLPRRTPGKRAPLWQQRQRSAQLLDVARKFPTFPILLETVRECLQDVYDLPALRDLFGRIARRQIRMVEVETATPSPFASSLLFDYVGAFMYEGDSPLAERRAAALSLDSTLLAELLGRVELRELLDADVIAKAERELQRLTPERHARDVEGMADLLRLLGPVTTEEAAERSTADPVPWLDELVAHRRALRVSFAGRQWWTAVEDAARLRDGLGVPLPIGTPAAFIEPVDDPLGDLLGRYARTHGPFTVSEAAERFGIGSAVARDVLARLANEKRVVEGEFRPGASGSEWCDAEVLRRLRRRSLAAAREEVEPVSTATLGRFLPGWQHVGGSLRGLDGVVTVVEQLAGVPVPASALESLILASRVRDYSPAMLDELTATGEVLWSGAGQISGKDGWVSLHLADSSPLTLATPAEIDLTDLHRSILDTLTGGGAYFFRQLSDTVQSTDDTALAAALWDLVWAGYIGNDTLAPLRALLSDTSRATPSHRTPRRAPRAHAYRRLGRPTMPTRSGPPTAGGRWSLLPEPEPDPTLRAHATADLLLERYGVVTRGSVVAEEVPGGFASMYKVLTGFEDGGRCRRGYFVDTLGGAQFSTPDVVDRLRTHSDSIEGRHTTAPAVTLAASDPANPYGAALPWPQSMAGDDAPKHRPGRKAGGLVSLVDGELVLFVERGGRTVLTFTDDIGVLRTAAESLAATVKRGGIDKVVVEKVDGATIHGNDFAPLLTEVGFSATPRGFRLRA
ncbi:ATP-dependent helicase [Prescottella equi]|uniref:ATP-dependent helicase n=1 Tax=Rhodococcus hoagii TaxID=43767 RepID=A0AAE5MIR6_RHOHA|nr:ATP-dependent helicase [Prescottella equi]ERN44313.1 dead/deah box helicase [Prescottella equi NBRC 101255 = C 7]MBM4629517.1 ATP-dependent helicase [Prescottella equi]ORL29701.1 DEAD/DEAH box helicase [Prescottella equi]ORM06191.1 DEAD/DEAH box helicase [Prescottella equi]ORM26510.1 DEAD/DEAH box helicase [Prescottella equi]